MAAGLHGIKSPADLARIARELTGWKAVRPFLDLTAAQEDAIESDHPNRTEEQRFSDGY